MNKRVVITEQEVFETLAKEFDFQGKSKGGKEFFMKAAKAVVRDFQIERKE